MILALLTSNVFAGSLPTASYVEVERYIGKWYAITSLPQFFTRSCIAQTAEYEIKSENSISVLNTCIKKDGNITSITGTATVVNPITNAELEVVFDNFSTRSFKIKGDYTIIKLDPDYEYVMVGSKDRKSLWIMSRENTMPKAILQKYVDFAAANGFDVSKLVDSKF